MPPPSSVYVPAVPSKSFGEILPGIKTYAELACKHGGSIPVTKEFFVPRQPYALLRGDAAAEKMRAGLGGCDYQPMRLEDGVSQEVDNILARTKALRELERVKKEERAAFASQRRHDLQLRNKYLDLAQRSCEIPGSVTQEELARLSLPYDEGFMAELPTGDCLKAVYKSLLKHESAEYIELVSRPRVIPRDAAAVSSLAAGLGPCETRLFRRLAEEVRAERGEKINAQWLADEIAA